MAIVIVFVISSVIGKPALWLMRSSCLSMSLFLSVWSSLSYFVVETESIQGLTQYGGVLLCETLI